MPDQSDASKCWPKFIRDEPASIDSFGAHTRLATAITRLISDDPQTKVIGILGPWGSGKSTVVGSIEKQVRDGCPTTHFFTYDAWLHQSDPVRRSFLEALVAFLAQEVEVDEEGWGKKLQDLNGSVEKTETETAPVLTTSGRIIIASLAFLPAGFALLGYDALKDSLATPPVKGAALALRAGVLLSLAPAIVALLLYFCWRPWGTRIFSQKFWRTNRKPHQKESILGLLSDRSVERTLNVTTRRPEPTSIEFQEIFRDLMNAASVDGDRFVFVIDNLDRLAEREALQIWSAVRAFFLGTSDTPIDKSSAYLPTVILPVDTNSIRRMFAVEHGEADAKELSKAFMDKTFDITFDVPEPVMSDWQDYLVKQLKECFDELIDAKDIFWAVRFVDDERRRRSDVITTPRSMNKFVNRIAALYNQRASSEIEIASLAYYAAFTGTIGDNFQQFIREPATSRPPADNWQVQLAAIHYGVDLTKARQILLSDPIRHSIEDLDYEAFRGLIDTPGFSTECLLVLSSPTLSEGGEAEFQFVTNAALLIDKEVATSEHWLDEAWRAIVNQYQSSSLGVASPDLGMRIATVFSHASDAQLRVSEVSATKIARMMLAVSVDALDTVIAAADRLVQESRLAQLDLPTFRPTLEPPRFVSLINRAASSPNVWKQLRSKIKAQEVAAVLAERLRNPTEFELVEPTLKLLLDDSFVAVPRGSEADWNGVISVANELLRNQNGSAPNIGMAAITLGVLQARFGNAATVLKSVIDEGHLAARTHEAAPAKRMQMLSSGYAMLICRGGDFGPPAGMSWPTFFQTFPNIGRDVAARIRQFFGPTFAPGVWDALQRAPNGQPLISAVIDDLAENGLGSLHLNKIVQGISNYLKPLTATQQRQFVRRLTLYEGFWNEIQSLDDVTYLRVAQLLKSSTGEDREKLSESVRSRLINAPADKWVAALAKGDSTYDLSMEFSADLPAWPQKGEPFQSLISQASAIAKSDDRQVIKRWFSLCRQLTSKGQLRTNNALAEQIAGGGYVGNLLVLLKESDGVLLKANALKPDALVRTVVVPLLDARPGRKWVQSHIAELKPRTAKASRDAIAGLRSEIDRLARSSSKWKQQDAADLRSAFELQ